MLPFCLRTRVALFRRSGSMSENRSFVCGYLDFGSQVLVSSTWCLPCCLRVSLVITVHARFCVVNAFILFEKWIVLLRAEIDAC